MKCPFHFKNYGAHVPPVYDHVVTVTTNAVLRSVT